MKITKTIPFASCHLSSSGFSVPEGSLSLSIGYLSDHGTLAAISQSDIEAMSAAQGTPTSSLPELPPLPEIEFMLQRAGNLAIGDIFRVPAQMLRANAEGSPQASSSIINDADAATMQAFDAATDKINNALSAEISAQIEKRGLFYQPFFVCYALVLADGTHLPASAPVLMPAYCLPPCLSVATCESNADYTSLTFTGAFFPYFKLSHRVKKMTLENQWTDRIQGIDIFVSLPILAYDKSDTRHGGFTTYRTLAQQHAGASPSQGSIVCGLWAEADGISAPRTLDAFGAAESIAWRLPQNAQFDAQLVTTNKFHKAAHIPLGQLIVDDEFRDTPILCTSAKALEAAMPLDINDPLLNYAHAAGAYEFGGRLFAIGGSYQVPAPQTISSLAPFVGNSALAQSSFVEVTAYSKHSGQVGMSSITDVNDPAINLRTSFPRYIYHPDPNAYAMRIRQGSTEITINLMRHPSLPGAYWYGGLASMQAPDTAPVALPDHAPSLVECLNRIVHTLPGSIAAAGAANVGSGSVIALASVSKTVSQGQYGLFPLYAIATDGIWPLKIDNAGVHALQRIYDAPISSDAQVCQFSDSAIVVSGKKILCISGSKCEPVADAIFPVSPDTMREVGYVTQVLSLPPLSQWLEACNPRQAIADASRGLLGVKCDDNLWIVRCRDGQWGMASDNLHVIVTRPIKLSADAPAASLVWARLITNASPHDVQFAMFGSNDQRQWHLLASARGPLLQAFRSMPMRYFIAVAEIDDLRPHAVYGLRICTR